MIYNIYIILFKSFFLQLTDLFEFDKISDVAPAMEFVKGVTFYKFEGLKEEPVTCMTNVSVTKIFKYLFKQSIFVNKLNYDFDKCDTGNVIDYLNILLDTGHYILSTDDKLGCKIFNYLDILNMLVYNIIMNMSDKSFVDFLEEKFNTDIDKTISDFKTLVLLNHESVKNIFSICKYFFDSITNDMPSAINFNLCIILFIYFGVPGITSPDILFRDDSVSEYVPIFSLKLKKHVL